MSADARDVAVELLHQHGIARIDLLDAELRSWGHRHRRASLERLADEYYEVRRTDDFYVSESPYSVAAVAARGARELCGENWTDVRAAVRRCLASGRLTGNDRRVAAGIFVDAFRHAVEPWPALEPHEWDTVDQHVIGYLSEQPGGVATVEAVRIEVEPDFNPSYSPLVEWVANGVIGVRGAEIDLQTIEQLRGTIERGPWSAWGRLDRHRLWVQGRVDGDVVRVRLTQDCIDLLAELTYSLVAVDGSRVGVARLDLDAALEVLWDQKPPEAWSIGRRAAVVEFDMGENPTARLHAGIDVAGDHIPRLVDGCVLMRGRWGAVVRVSTKTDSPARVPLALEGVKHLGVGVDVVLQCRETEVIVRREPHACIVRGLDALVAEHNDSEAWVRLAFLGDGVVAEVAAFDPDAMAVLLCSAGVFDEPPSPWVAIGTALGIGATDRAGVRKAWADRERFDLAALVDDAVTTAANRPRGIDVADLDVAEGALKARTHPSRYADGHRGSGALGLRWTDAPPLEDASSWAETVLMLLRAWAAASSVDGVGLTRTTSGTWAASHTGASYASLTAALRDLAAVTNSIQLPVGGPAWFPETGFALRRALGRLEDVDELVLDREGWWSSSDGAWRGPTYVAATAQAQARTR